MRLLARLSRMRLQRLRARASIERLSVESGIPAGPLSEAERGLRRLTREQEKRRLAALERLRAAATGLEDEI